MVARFLHGSRRFTFLDSSLVPFRGSVRCSRRQRNGNPQMAREKAKNGSTTQGNGNPSTPMLRVRHYGSSSLFSRIITPLSPCTQDSCYHPNPSRPRQTWHSTPSLISSTVSFTRTRKSRTRNRRDLAQCSPLLETRSAVEG